MLYCRANHHPIRSLGAFFSLCPECRHALIPSPVACPDCYGFHSSGSERSSERTSESSSVEICPFPALRIHGVDRSTAFDSLTPFFLLTDQSKAIFREWKKNRSIFNAGKFISLSAEKNPSTLDFIRKLPEMDIIPVPQRGHRILRLGRSTILEVALAVGVLSGKKVLPELFGAKENTTQQGSKMGRHRYLSENAFFLRDLSFTSRLREEVLVVDDFMTSGHTLRHFVQLLKYIGIKRVHIAVLALRPVNSRGLDLSTRCRHAVTIGEKQNLG